METREAFSTKLVCSIYIIQQDGSTENYLQLSIASVYFSRGGIHTVRIRYKWDSGMKPHSIFFHLATLIVSVKMQRWHSKKQMRERERAGEYIREREQRGKGNKIRRIKSLGSAGQFGKGLVKCLSFFFILFL